MATGSRLRKDSEKDSEKDSDDIGYSRGLVHVVVYATFEQMRDFRQGTSDGGLMACVCVAWPGLPAQFDA